tara:strand:- start:730 stop:966 length:237 start_codon:yes stop_codon:yes gene_type:complete
MHKENTIGNYLTIELRALADAIQDKAVDDNPFIPEAETSLIGGVIALLEHYIESQELDDLRFAIRTKNKEIESWQLKQ